MNTIPNIVIVVFAMCMVGCAGTNNKNKLDADKSGGNSVALSVWKPLAERGDVVAQVSLGVMYMNGAGGVTQDFEAAFKWIKLAADQGYADAGNILGVMYKQGLGVTQDFEAAFKWFKSVAEKSHLMAMRSKGYADALHNLGVMYKQGLGVTQDFEAAFKWIKLAAEQTVRRYPHAKYDLGLMYYEGQGVTQDYTKAYIWWNIAVALRGHEKAMEYLDIVEKKMTPAQVEKARKLSRECMARSYRDC